MQPLQKGSLSEAVVLLTVSMMTLGMQSGGFASTHTVRVGWGWEYWEFIGLAPPRRPFVQSGRFKAALISSTFHPKQDISTRYASALFGITNAGASLGGLVFVYLVGIILDQTKSWSLVFSTVAVLNFISAAVYALWANCEPQFE